MKPPWTVSYLNVDFDMTGLMLCYIHTHTPPVLLNHCHLHSSVTLLGEQSLNLVSDVSWSWSALVDCQATSAAVPSIGLWTLDGSALFPHGVLSPIAILVSLLVTQTLQFLAQYAIWVKDHCLCVSMISIDWKLESLGIHCAQQNVEEESWLVKALFSRWGVTILLNTVQ